MTLRNRPDTVDVNKMLRQLKADFPDELDFMSEREAEYRRFLTDGCQSVFRPHPWRITPVTGQGFWRDLCSRWGAFRYNVMERVNAWRSKTR